jgi:hypothetical protein
MQKYDISAENYRSKNLDVIRSSNQYLNANIKGKHKMNKETLYNALFPGANVASPRLVASPRPFSEAQINYQNCTTFSLDQLRSTTAYRNFPGKSKLNNKALICNTLFNPANPIPVQRQLNPTNLADCKMMKVDDLRSTAVYKSLPNKKSLTNKTLICNAIQQSISFAPTTGMQRLVASPRVSPISPAPQKVLNANNCTTFPKRDLVKTQEYKQLPNKSLLTTKDKICAAIYRPHLLQLAPTVEVTAQNCGTFSVSELKATAAYKNLPSTIGKSKLKKADLCNAILNYQGQRVQSPIRSPIRSPVRSPRQMILPNRSNNLNLMNGLNQQRF